MNARPRYSARMPSFILDGTSYEYLMTPRPRPLHLIKSWDYGQWPRVEATVPLADGSTVSVYGEASCWGAEQVHVRWADDEERFHAAWLPAASVRRMTA